MAYFQPTRASERSSQVPYYGSDPFISGFKMNHTSTTTFTLSAGAARAFQNDFVISYPENSFEFPNLITVDITTVGENGCSPILMSEAAPSDNTSFGVYILGDSSGKNRPVAVVATADDFLLDGYDSWRRVGMVQNVGGSDILVFMYQDGNGIRRDYLLNSALPIITGGSSGTYALIDLTSGDAPCHPDFTARAMMSWAYTPITAASTLSIINSTAPIPSYVPVVIKLNVDAVEAKGSIEFATEVNSNSVSAYYKTTSGSDSVNLFLSGFTEDMGLSAL